MTRCARYVRGYPVMHREDHVMSWGLKKGRWAGGGGGGGWKGQTECEKLWLPLKKSWLRRCTKLFPTDDRLDLQLWYGHKIYQVIILFNWLTKNKTKKSILVILLPVSTISRRELLNIAILVIPDFISFINWSFTEQFVENTLMSAIGSTK